MVGAQDDLVRWLRAFDVFVLPTLHEGLPHSLAQAMSCGCCCVTTRVGGIPEIATDGRWPAIVTVAVWGWRGKAEASERAS